MPDQKLAIKIAQYRKDKLPAEQAWFLEKMKELEIACTIDGEWVQWDKPMEGDWRQVTLSRRQLAKFLRHAYLNGGPATLRGQALDAILNAFLNGIERATKRVFEAKVPGAIKEICIHD
jgi:hypothetical protein